MSARSMAASGETSSTWSIPVSTAGSSATWGSTARMVLPVNCRAMDAVMFSAGDSRRSSMFGLNASPRAATTGARPVACCTSNALALTWSITHCGLESLISRALRMIRAASGAASTMNHGSTAMQCPPTPGPGCSTLTRGWWLASSISSQTSMSSSWQIIDSSLAKAMFTSRNEFSTSLAISAVRRLVSRISPWQKVSYSPFAASAAAREDPPTIRSLVTSSVITLPGSTRSGQCANSRVPASARSGRTSWITAAIRSVAPGGEVDSRITNSLPRSCGARLRPAASM